MNDARLNELSKILSHALRHCPEAYNVTMDKSGWVNLDELLNSIRCANKNFSDLSERDVHDALNRGKRARHEIKNKKIRAMYGHSIQIEANSKDIGVPPVFLFHGTPEKNVEKIQTEGLLSMERILVHLFESKSDAIQKAMRKSNHVACFQVDTVRAIGLGVKFYKKEAGLWVATDIDNSALHIIS
ncbi:RNA 2'-phosphotransferase [Ruegeria atlantica]|uniref:RNA 2'-phosphotransferase n=1 Tax=Ruegeria atlantica TaxID=81569 RepID=UPI0024944640|nr:RNA 2'-phosphotransferase [Ruegeria atlantica]